MWYVQTEFSPCLIHTNLTTEPSVWSMFIRPKPSMYQLYVNNGCSTVSLCLCSAQPLTDLRTRQKLWFFLLLPFSLSYLCAFMKQIHKVLHKMKHFQLMLTRICINLCQLYITFTPQKINFALCLNTQ